MPERGQPGRMSCSQGPTANAAHDAVRPLGGQGQYAASPRGEVNRLDRHLCHEAQSVRRSSTARDDHLAPLHSERFNHLFSRRTAWSKTCLDRAHLDAASCTDQLAARAQDCCQASCRPAARSRSGACSSSSPTATIILGAKGSTRRHSTSAAVTEPWSEAGRSTHATGSWCRKISSNRRPAVVRETYGSSACAIP